MQVDQAKVEVVAKLHPPFSVKGVQSFLGHVGFYRRFIKDFYKVANPLCKFLEKESTFNFDEACLKAFLFLKEKLVLVSRPDFSSHAGTYYKPPAGKPTRNPEQQVMGLRLETKQE
ncbi:hypothetical protein MTR67_051833 [Solanum verrucosum]|uniref:Reverse transcriptase/retrotransposon-derived protein RNase H-like domain-containing protein n=1 Tax=Solanum verrucosum TaxID=315347 RepID=A0AAF0V415_SOLVR|nr:hypothetical protein MTR67_051833 [Solanum verrucosum]